MASSRFSPSFEQRSTVDFLSSCPRISGNINAAAAYTVGPDAGFASRELCVVSCARCVFPSATASWFYHYHLQPRPPPPGPTPTRGLQHKNRRKARESPFRQLLADFSGLRWKSHFPLLLLNLIVGLPLAKDTHSHSLRPHKHLMRDGKRMRDMERGVGRERERERERLGGAKSLDCLRVKSNTNNKYARLLENRYFIQLQNKLWRKWIFEHTTNKTKLEPVRWTVIYFLTKRI